MSAPTSSSASGLVLGAAAGASNVAFLFAGFVYVCIGLAYTELAATYPVAGGGQYFVLRGLGDIFGFIAGWAVLLDFTIDIALFAWSCVDYLEPASADSFGNGRIRGHTSRVRRSRSSGSVR